MFLLNYGGKIKAAPSYVTHMEKYIGDLKVIKSNLRQYENHIGIGWRFNWKPMDYQFLKLIGKNRPNSYIIYGRLNKQPITYFYYKPSLAGGGSFIYFDNGKRILSSVALLAVDIDRQKHNSVWTEPDEVPKYQKKQFKHWLNFLMNEIDVKNTNIPEENHYKINKTILETL